MSKKQVESLHLYDPNWEITEAQYEADEQKSFDWFSYLMILIATLLILAASTIDVQAKPNIITPKTYNQDAKSEVFDKSNTAFVNAWVYKVKKKNKKYYVTYSCFDEYDGEIFVEKYTKAEYKEVKFHKHDKANLWIYQNETPSDHSDDIIIHAMRGWYFY